MKCVLCNGSLKEKQVEHKEFGVLVGEFNGLACTSCSEVFYNSGVVDKIQTKSKKLDLFGLAKKLK